MFAAILGNTEIPVMLLNTGAHKDFTTIDGRGAWSLGAALGGRSGKDLKNNAGRLNPCVIRRPHGRRPHGVPAAPLRTMATQHSIPPHITT